MERNEFEKPRVEQGAIEFPEPQQETAVQKAGITEEELAELDKKEPDDFLKGRM